MLVLAQVSPRALRFRKIINAEFTPIVVSQVENLQDRRKDFKCE
jgi:hypothetical protein